MPQDPPGVQSHYQGSEEKGLKGCSWDQVGPASSGHRIREQVPWQHRLHTHCIWGLRTENGGEVLATGAAGNSTEIPVLRWGEAM